MTALSTFLGREPITLKIVDLSIDLCVKFNLADQPEVVCPGMIGLMTESVLGVLEDDIFTRKRMCN
jgi:hypothetical protein